MMHLYKGLPKTPTVRQNWINLTYEYVDTEETSERFSQTNRQDLNNTSPKTLFWPPSPMFIKYEMDNPNYTTQ